MAIAYDAATVSALIGATAVRINCLLSGCCDGVSCAGLFNWPLVEMEMLLYVSLIVFYWNRVYCGKLKGIAYPQFALIYGIFRFIVEWFREEYTGQVWIFHMAHIWSLIAIAGSIIALLMIRKYYQNNLYSKHRKNAKREVN